MPIEVEFQILFLHGSPALVTASFDLKKENDKVSHWVIETWHV